MQTVMAQNFVPDSAAYSPEINKIEKRKITSLLENFGRALNAGDTETLVRSYTPDGGLMAPNAPPAIGTQALYYAYFATFQAIDLEIAMRVEEVQLVAPDWAYARTSSSGATRLLATNQVVPEANQELFVLHRLNGNWKIVRYSFSTILPL